MRRAGLAVTLALMGHGAAAVTAADGQRAYDAGRFGAAADIWEGLARGVCTSEAAPAQLGLGALYDLGEGVGADPIQAYRWYLRAAEAGLPEAEFNIGVMNDSGTGTPRDPAAAAAWYAKAAARGHPRAQYNLAQMYSAGQGVPRNPEAAATWLRAAATGKLPAAMEAIERVRRAGPGPALPARLQPATLIAPAPGETHPGWPDHATAFVWTAPPQPGPVRYYLEIFQIDGQEPVEIVSRYVDPTAAVVDLPSTPAQYGWRVSTVGGAGADADYVLSAWAVFSQD